MPMIIPFAEFRYVDAEMLPAVWKLLGAPQQNQCWDVAMGQITEHAGIRLPEFFINTMPRKDRPRREDLFKNGEIHLPVGPNWRRWVKTSLPYRIQFARRQLIYVVLTAEFAVANFSRLAAPVELEESIRSL